MREQLNFRAIGLGRLGKSYEGRVFVGLQRRSIRGKGEIRLIGDEEEELLVRYDRAADAKGHVVDVVGGQFFGWGTPNSPLAVRPW